MFWKWNIGFKFKISLKSFETFISAFRLYENDVMKNTSNVTRNRQEEKYGSDPNGQSCVLHQPECINDKTHYELYGNNI